MTGQKNTRTGLWISTSSQIMWHLPLLYVVHASFHSSLGNCTQLGNSDLNTTNQFLVNTNVGNDNSMDDSGTRVFGIQNAGGIDKVNAANVADENNNFQITSSILSSVFSLQISKKQMNVDAIPENSSESVSAESRVKPDILESLEEHRTSSMETLVHFKHPIIHKLSDGIIMEDSQIGLSKQLNDDRQRIVNENPLSAKHGSEIPDQYNVRESIMNHDLSGYSDPCGLGFSSYVVSNSSNGTKLLWDDMRRTLAFVWELHVFGSASLFVFLAGTSMLGIAGGLTLVQPLCDALTQANSLLLMAGALRAVFLLFDPYGTRQILSRAALAVLQNSPLQLLLWAQAALTLVTLRGTKLVLLPVKLQRPRLVGGLAAFHCILLLIADLLSPTVSSNLPLLLQTLSLCWGLPFCIGILIKSVSHPQSCITTRIPQWGTTSRTENRAKRISAVCALFGILCCCLHIHSLLWIYGVLGNWRRFGWGWWLSQFWARVLELSWGFSLVFLGSLMTWTPRWSHHGQTHGRLSRGQRRRAEVRTVRDKVLLKIKKGSFRTSENNLEDQMPNEWTRQQLPRTIFNSAMCNTIPANIHSPGNICDSQAVGEQNCVLSLVEFDMWPPSPINLRRSIDNALHHGSCTVACLFTSPPPHRNHEMGVDDNHSYTPLDVSPTDVGYIWTLNSESTPTLPDHFQAKESIQTSNAITFQISDHSSNTQDEDEGQITVNNSKISTILHLEDWPVDDITDL